jgi:outer membrane protein assembly factor BamB
VQGDAAHTGFAAEAVAPPLKKAWRLGSSSGGPSAAFGLSAPVVAGSAVVAVGPRTVIAADLDSGQQLWNVGKDFGPSVPPAVADAGKRQVLIFTEGFGDSPPGASPSASTSVAPSPSANGSNGGFDSHLTAINLATQDPAWKTPLQLKEVSRTGVTVDGTTAIVGDNRGNVYAVDTATGELRWTADAGGFLTNPLAVADGLIVASVQGNRTTRASLVAFKESDGTRAWQVEVQGAAVLASSPAIVGGRIIVGFSDQTVRSFDLSDGTEQWSARLNSPLTFLSAVAVTTDAVVAADLSGEVYRLDLATGARVWDFALNEPVLRSPVVIAGDVALVATAKGRLAAFDMGSGRLVWQSEPSGSVLRSLTPTPQVVVGVTGGGPAGLLAFAHDPDGTAVSIVSPTQVDLTSLLGAFAIAAIPLAALLLLCGRALRARMGPAFLDDEAATDDGSPDRDGDG